jgi:peptidoglycan/xylan/chitin deacetylase (PgdA/CDA1 family)
VLAWGAAPRPGPAPGAAAAPAPAPAPAPAGAVDRRVAVTVDDLPFVPPDLAIAKQAAATGRILAALARHRVPAVGFVNEDKLEPRPGDPPAPPAKTAAPSPASPGVHPARLALLERWLDAGHELGNHGYAHLSLHRRPRELWQDDVLRGERVLRPLLAARGTAPRYFRHPFLHTGRELATKQATARFLAEHGYTIAPVTFDSSEWIYAKLYEEAAARDDQAARQRIAASYLEYMAAKVAYFEGESQQLFGRNLPHVLLLHANRLNADHLGALLDGLAARGYRFVSLSEALADEAYRLPDTYTRDAGVSWLHRWAIARGLAAKQSDFFAADPRVPRWVLEAAGMERE